jgi:hypothetical protein
MEEKKYNLRQRLNSNDIFPRPQQINKSKFIIERNNDKSNAYKRPINKIPNNTRALNVYRPKRPGAVRGRSQEKAGPPNLSLNNKTNFKNS